MVNTVNHNEHSISAKHNRLLESKLKEFQYTSANMHIFSY